MIIDTYRYKEPNPLLCLGMLIEAAPIPAVPGNETHIVSFIHDWYNSRNVCCG